jgi:hypothetical protein
MFLWNLKVFNQLTFIASKTFWIKNLESQIHEKNSFSSEFLYDRYRFSGTTQISAKLRPFFSGLLMNLEVYSICLIL